MAWKKCRVMDERARLIRVGTRRSPAPRSAPAEVHDGPCERAGISRTIGYKWLGRDEVAVVG
jgi:hypothetical protein